MATDHRGDGGRSSTRRGGGLVIRTTDTRSRGEGVYWSGRILLYSESRVLLERGTMCAPSMCTIYVLVFIAIVAIKLCMDGMISGPSLLVHHPVLPPVVTENRHGNMTAVLFTLIIAPSPSSSNLISADGWFLSLKGGTTR